MDELIERLIELKRIRDDAQAGIEAILGGNAVVKRQRAPQKCGKCGSTEHNSRSCTQHEMKTAAESTMA